MEHKPTDIRFHGDLLLEKARQLQERLPLTGRLTDDRQFIVDSFGGSFDLVQRPLSIGDRQAFLFTIDQLTDDSYVDQAIIKPIISYAGKSPPSTSAARLCSDLQGAILTAVRSNRLKTYADIFWGLNNGSVVILIDGLAEALEIEAQGFKSRGVQEPKSDAVIRGIHMGFVEHLTINTAMFRRYISSSALKIESLKVGRYGQSRVAIIYLSGVADPKTIDELKRRLGRIQIDAALDVSYLGEMIRDSPLSPFPLLLRTERTDTAVSAVLEGRFAVLVDGSPAAILGPAFFLGFFLAAEDSYLPSHGVSAIRMLRYTSFLIAILLPGFWVALASVNQELIPGPLLISLARARIGIPLPIMAEVLILELAVDIVHEAGLRLPGQGGQTITVVAALVVGSAAVRAGLVSAPVIIIIALTAISTFTTPSYEMQQTTRLLRIPALFLAGFLGFFGLAVYLTFVVVHLVSLRSFGVSYFTPFAPFRWEGFSETVIRPPRWYDRFRPPYGWPNTLRIGSGSKPGPKSGKSN